MSILYVVATPIGNLEDITFRAVRILKEVDLILCEDTRQTKKLIEHYQVDTPLVSYHQHSRLRKINFILELLREDKSLALVSDAGTPGISDPGQLLIQRILRELPQTKIIPIPGTAALIAAASISGFFTDKFLFLGFLPRKGKKEILNKIKEGEFTIIFYESPYRIIKTLEELMPVIKERKVVLTRELTKKFETIYRGKGDEVLNQLLKDKVKGEFTVVVARK